MKYEPPKITGLMSNMEEGDAACASGLSVCGTNCCDGTACSTGGTPVGDKRGCCSGSNPGVMPACNPTGASAACCTSGTKPTCGFQSIG